MKKFTLITVILLCSFTSILYAQFIKIDASFYSEALDEMKKVDIYLPSDYYENLDQEYAVIYFLHGAGGNQNTGYKYALWYYALHSQDSSITSPPAIFVCPDGSCEPYSGSDYINSELYGNYADYTTIDLIEFIENNFRAKPERDFRFVCGRSMGGFGSVFHTVDKPELYRASFPYVGFPAVTEDLITLWRDTIYEDCGSYTNMNLNLTSCQLFLTMAGGISPNIELPPYYVEFPWDSTGALVDSVVNKWSQFDASSKIRNIPQENNMTFFLGCGTQDWMGTYPLYLQFMDSLDFYGIPYQYNFYEGGHLDDDFETWQKGFHWMDSIINYSFQTMGIEIFKPCVSELLLYPNPMSSQLTVSFNNIRRQTVEIGIYNLQGQPVQIIPAGMQNAGPQKHILNTTGLMPGIYLLRLKTGNDVVTRKVVKL